MNDIKLDMEVLRQNNETYTSVTDLYGVHIFTDTDMKEFQIRETMENSCYDGIKQTIFLDKWEGKNNLVQSSLFLKETSVSKRQEVLDNSVKTNIGMFFIGFLVLVIFILSMIRYNIYRMVRRKRDADKDNFYQ